MMLMLNLSAGSSPATTQHSSLALVRGFLLVSPSQRTNTRHPLTGSVYGWWLIPHIGVNDEIFLSFLNHLKTVRVRRFARLSAMA